MRIALILLPLIYGCAFKDAPETGPVNSTQTITLSWTGDREYAIKRTLQKTDEGYLAPTPITLSSPVPPSIFIEATLPLTASIYVESAMGTRDGVPYALAASFREGRLEINGLRSVLADDKDQQLDLVLRARDSSGGSPWSLSITLLTLPTPGQR